KALDDTARHWNDRHEKLTLRISGRGSERIRELELYDRREPGDEQKTILFFLAPAGVKGTAVLAYTHKGPAGDRWLYRRERPRGLELHEDDKEPKKRLTQTDVRPVGKIPVAYHVLAETPGAGTRTVIETSDVQFDQNLEADLFTQRYLERGGR